MKRSIKFSGAAIITAVFLMLTRMIPIFASGAITLEEFPLDSAAATANLAVAARSGWEMSHLMLLAALLLFFVGYLVLYQVLNQHSQTALGLLFIVILGTGLLFYAIAGVIDGFLVTAVANHLGLLAGTPADSTLTFVSLGHEAALSFFGQAQTGIVLGIGLLATALWRARLLNRWLVGIGAGLSALALVGLLAGVFGAHWRTFATAGPIMMLFFFWQLALGIALVRSQEKAVPAPAVRLQESTI